MFADRSDTVMARAASADYLSVVHCESWNPDVRVMAVFANICCQHMCRVFARCFDAVVTADAIAGDVQVIKIRGQPADG